MPHPPRLVQRVVRNGGDDGNATRSEDAVHLEDDVMGEQSVLEHLVGSDDVEAVIGERGAVQIDGWELGARDVQQRQKGFKTLRTQRPLPAAAPIPHPAATPRPPRTQEPVQIVVQHVTRHALPPLLRCPLHVPPRQVRRRRQGCRAARVHQTIGIISFFFFFT